MTCPSLPGPEIETTVEDSSGWPEIHKSKVDDLTETSFESFFLWSISALEEKNGENNRRKHSF